MNKLIIENRTDMSMQEAMIYAKHVVSDGYISNDNTQYCYATTWPNGIVVASHKNDKSDRLVIYRDERLIK